MAKRIKKPEGTLWPDEVHERYRVAVATLSQWRYYGVGPTPIKVGQKFVAYDAEECRQFFRGWKPRDRVNTRQYKYNYDHISPERLYMVNSTDQIAQDLRMSKRDVIEDLKTGSAKFIQHWAWMHCLMRYGLSLDEAALLVAHKDKKYLSELLDPHLLAIDFMVENPAADPDRYVSNKNIQLGVALKGLNYGIRR